MISRRGVLSGVSSALATATAGQALARAPEVSLYPRLRPDGLFQRSVPPIAQIVAEAGLAGEVGCAVADAETGEVLETYRALRPMPPASVAKALTTAYALDRLGPGYRFRTLLVSDGSLADGRLDGDLWLIGGGDPLLDTDALVDMARSLSDIGLREVTGSFRVASDALPFVDQIDPAQLPYAGYNPSISALNLNFNRVFFEWRRVEGGYDVTLDARGVQASPSVDVARMVVADRSFPVYTYEQGDERDEWTVARGALDGAGGRWLPVRRPQAYLAEVFRTVASAQGIALGPPVFSESAPSVGGVLVEHVSDPLEDVLRGMMRWSTNLTAEVVGLLSTQAGGVRPTSLADSAGEMNSWLRESLGARNPRLVDHSGLGVASRITPSDMVRTLVSSGSTGLLRGLMKEIPILDGNGAPVPDHPLAVVAKTGTLNFVSTLAGYAEPPSGRVLAFSVFCADLERRAALPVDQMERPPGGRSYIRRAKRLQQTLLERWSAMFG